MNILLPVLATLAIATAMPYRPDFGEGQLYEDLHDLADLVPTRAIKRLSVKYFVISSEFRRAKRYIESNRFREFLSEAEDIPYFHYILQYLENAKVRGYNIINYLNSELGVQNLEPLPEVPAEYKLFKGLSDYFEDVKSLLPLKKYAAICREKYENSEEFRNFVEYLKSGDVQSFIDELYSLNEFKYVRRKLQQYNVKVESLENKLSEIFGVVFPRGKIEQIDFYDGNDLEEDFKDFVALVPVEKVTAIVLRYLSEDEQVIAAITYAQSEDFHRLVRMVEALEEYKDFVIYLHNAGVKVFDYIQHFHKGVGMEDYVPPVAVKLEDFEGSQDFQYDEFKTGGIVGLVKEIKAVLPMKEIRKLYAEKLENSKAFREFVELLRSEDFLRIVEELYKNEVFIEVREKAKEAGLDLKAISDLIHTILGIKLPTVD